MPRYDPGVLSGATVVSGASILPISEGLEAGSWELETKTERYRSGRNGGASKASCRVSGTGVRIPPSPPPFAPEFARRVPTVALAKVGRSYAPFELRVASQPPSPIARYAPGFGWQAASASGTRRLSRRSAKRDGGLLVRSFRATGGKPTFAAPHPPSASRQHPSEDVHP